MTDAPELSKTDRNIARQSRLRDALRENLKRRKSQLRGRAEQPAPPPGRAAATPPEPSETSPPTAEAQDPNA
ncbi:hypothetical protein HNR60_002743 [Rhodopseudomonas rhenobacensis]|uniref:Uncharacterized protein n=1 Tax=Rhodopseudomonas rhenobacensis TaxID=87461 RepID=A0A7W7Z4T6_9BRAD|nr:hypothetical protein [Rhodopseudomonas rhenobacensis]MBB5047984.1 hypothetical protein [Rhodopseudomonas rhenobacensis]